MNDLQAKAQKLQGEQQRGFGGFGKPKPTITLVNGEFSGLSETSGQADQAPTAAMHAAYHDYCQDMTKVARQWSDLMKQDLPAVNTQLSAEHLQTIAPVMETLPTIACGQ